MEAYGTPILQVLSGSKATGCETEESDTDKLGIFSAPTSDLLTFGSKVDFSVKKNNETGDDVTWWEAKKAFSILRKGNFNALPLLFSKHIIFNSNAGRLLRDHSMAFISKRFVRSMLGFSRDQLKRYREGRALRNSNQDKALACIYRELITGERLCLVEWGQFSLPLCEIEREYFLSIKYGQEDKEKLVTKLEGLYNRVDGLLNDDAKQLPDKPDEDTITGLLLEMRNMTPRNNDAPSPLWEAIE